MAATYPIRTVARLTGISLDLLRAWERRYRAVEPRRVGRGRLYTDQDVERLYLLRDLVNRGYAISQIASKGDRELKELLRSAAGVAQLQQPVEAEELSPAVTVVEAIEAYRYAEARREIWRLAGTFSTRDFVFKVAIPLMQAVGRLWHGSRISVAQEHMASALLRSAMGGMLTEARGNRETSFVVASPTSERHEFGILAAAVLASAHGYEVTYLGPDVPAEDIAGAAERTGARVVLVGLLNANSDEAPAHGLRVLAGKLPEEVELWAGGPQRPSNVPRRVKWFTDLHECEKQIQRLCAKKSRLDSRLE
jgi:DNA-binding transcriptional MerR regulator/methylmalonyl-CoA mutase cobalamin-binding subunit